MTGNQETPARRRRGAFAALTTNFVRSSFRNRTAMFFTLGLAFLFMVIFGLLFGGSGPIATVGIVNQDGTTTSAQAFISSLQHVSALNTEQGDESAENDHLNSSKIDVMVVIPKGFDAAVNHAPGAAPVTLTLREGSATSAAVNTSNQIIQGIASGMGYSGVTPTVTTRTEPPTATVNNIKGVEFFLPSMIGYIILQSGINFVAIGLVEMRVRKVLRRLRSTPLRPAQILAAQVTGGAMTVLLQIVVLVLVGKFLFGANNYGSWLVAIVPIVLGTGAFVGIGFLLTSAARTSESARALASMIALPMMFLTGIFFPITALPSWLQTLVHILPLTWLSDALHQVMNNGASLGMIAGDCLVLAAWAVVTLAIATWRFRWD